MNAIPSGEIGSVPNGHLRGQDQVLERSNPTTTTSAVVNTDVEPHIGETPRDLSAVDVAALIINKMIGTGIFSSPFYVLINSPNKTTAIGLWTCGYIYTILSMIMYLEFARKLPFTGGELVYLDDIFSRFPLFTTTLYTFYFVFVYTTSTNAMYFAAQVLLAADEKTRIRDVDVDQRNLRFLAVAVTTVICLILYLSSSRSRQLNKLTAFAKVLLLVVICGFGIAYLSVDDRVHLHLDDWGNGTAVSEVKLPSARGISHEESIVRKWPSAIITILFSFHGWENATLVAGEIPSFSVLRKGTIWALGVVGGLYLLVATVVSLAFTWNEDQLAQSYALENYAAVFLNVGNDPEKPSGMVAVATAILISISAVGSMISVAYTCVRVKQSIGWTNILPLSFYWRRSGPLQPQYQRISRDNRSDRIAVRLSLPNSNGFSYIGTPEGGIVLHWIVTVFYICVTASINSLDKAISFSANLLVYGHFFIEALVGLGFTWFKPIDLRPRPKGYPARRWFPDDDLPDRGRWMRDKDWNKFDQSPGIFKLAIKWLSSGLFQTVIGLLVAILSGVLIVLEAIPTGSPTAWGFVNLIVTMAIMLAAAVYWAFLVPAASSDGCSKTRFGFDLLLSTHGINDETDPERICYFCEIFHAIELLNLNLNQNHPREVQQQAQEGGHRHPHYGYLHYVSRSTQIKWIRKLLNKQR